MKTSKIDNRKLRSPALKRILLQIFSAGIADEALATVAGLHESTVRKLRGGVTFDPHFNTIERLSFAAGFILLCQERAGKARAG